MTKLNTVLGIIDTSELGFTLMHEHLVCSVPGISNNYPELFGSQHINNIITKLKKAKDGGVVSIVDASTFDLGRDVSLLSMASLQSGVNIITCSGWYSDPGYLADIFSIDQFAELFIREVDEGISGTGIKAGILKAAVTVEGMTKGREIILRAIARAHLKTGIPILLHSSAPDKVGKQQVDILREEKINLNRVKIDHCLETTDLGYLVWLLEQGCYLGMDPLPGVFIDLIDRVKIIKKLVDAGWTHKLLLSHDLIISLASTDIPVAIKEEIEKNNPYGFLYIKQIVLPMLQNMGIHNSIIESICIDNPRKYFDVI